MTGRELIRLQATLQGLPDRRGQARAPTPCSSGSTWPTPPTAASATYSGGMQRRLDLAAALVHEPRVLFLDEPTTGLDPVSRKTIWEEVRALNDDGTTVFLTTQYLEEADQLADNVGIIDSGRIVAEGTPESLKAEIGNPHIQLQLAEGSVAEAERVCAEVGKLLPPKDGKTVLVEVENGAADIPARRAGPRRGRDRGRVAGAGPAPPSTTSSSPRPATTSRRTSEESAEPRPVEA